MGSKTPDGHGQGPNGSSSNVPISSANPPKTDAATGLLQGTLEGQDEDGDDDDDSNGNGANLNDVHDQTTNGTKKKRKRTKKKSKKAVPTVQTSPPRVPLIDIFLNEVYPEGEIADYTNKEWTSKDENLRRTTAEELRHLAAVTNMDETFLRDYRKAAEIHRQVRQYAQGIAKPGITMTKLAHEIDEGVRALTGHPGLEKGDALKAGLAFPTGLCLNNIGAHWTPNAGGKEVVLGYDDVLKVDFGVHVNGRIVDSAFTVAANPVYDPLLDAVRAATNTGLKEAGPDARISHISRTIQEVMESYEVTLNNNTIPVKAVRNITGHNILHYRIHGDKQVPFIASSTSQRMEEGDIFAIETFGTTGRGILRDGEGVYGYGLTSNSRNAASGMHHKAAKSLLKVIEQNFGTLVFAKRYLERVDDLKNERNWHLGMRTLVQAGVVERYAPLVDVEGSYIAQFEHTVLLRPNCKEVVSRGNDY